MPEFRSLGWCDKEETPILDGPMLCQTGRNIAYFLALLPAIQDSCDEDFRDNLFSLSITCSPVCECTNVYFWDENADKGILIVSQTVCSVWQVNNKFLIDPIAIIALPCQSASH